MSQNTQTQGRNELTESSFTFTVKPGEDMLRALLRWEIELQRQLYVGDVTHDAAAKQAALMEPTQPAPATPSPAPSPSSSTPPAQLVLTTAFASKTFNQGDTASFTPITASGGTGSKTFSVHPSMLNGLSFNTSTGAVSGTTRGTGFNQYTVEVTDSGTPEPQTATASFAVQVNQQSSAPTPAPTPTPAPAFATTVAVASKLLHTADVASFTPVTAANGTTPYVFAISPSLGNGLSMSTSTGAITGTVTGTLAQTTYTVSVHDSATTPATGSGQFALTITA